MFAHLMLVLAAAHPLEVIDFDIAFDAVVVNEPALSLTQNEGAYAVDGVVLWCPADIAQAAKGLRMPGQHTVIVRDINSGLLRSVPLQGPRPALADDLEKFAHTPEVEAQGIRLRRIAAPTGSAFFVTQLCKSDRYGRAGLRTGDVVVGVHGVSPEFLPSTASLKGLKAKEAKEIHDRELNPRPGTIDVIRDGEPMTITVDSAERAVAGDLRAAARAIHAQEQSAFQKRGLH